MKAVRKILLAFDDEYVCSHLINHFSHQQFEIYKTSSGQEALTLYKEHEPSIVILNLVLTEVEGMEVCRQIREISPQFPPYIVVISGHSEEYTEVAAFQNGADDYIRKPIRIRAFLKRLQAAWERIKITQERTVPNILIIDDHLSIFPKLYIVLINGENIQLPRKEFRLLEYLANNPNQVISRESLIKEVWEKDVVVSERTVDVHVTKIRRIIGYHYIQTVKGIGYRFVIPEENEMVNQNQKS